MPGFNYTAINRNEARPLLFGCVVHRDREKLLRGAGYTILDIKEQTTLNRDIEIPFLGKPKAKDMAVFCRQFVSILRAGVSVASVLSMLGQQTGNKSSAPPSAKYRRTWKGRIACYFHAPPSQDLPRHSGEYGVSGRISPVIWRNPSARWSFISTAASAPRAR